MIFVGLYFCGFCWVFLFSFFLLACFFVVVAGFVGVVFVGDFVCFWLVDWWLLSIVVVVCLLLIFFFFSLFVGLFGGVVDWNGGFGVGIFVC